MDVLMPQLGETVAEGKITKWFKSAGDAVKPGDNLFEIETDKVSMEVPSTTTGTLAEIRVGAGEVAPVGAVVAVIADGSGGDGERAAASAGSDSRPRPPMRRTPLAQRMAAMAPHASLVTPPAATARGPLDPFFEVRTPERNYGPARLPGGAVVTPLARRLAAERGIDLSRLTGSRRRTAASSRRTSSRRRRARRAPACGGRRPERGRGHGALSRRAVRGSAARRHAQDHRDAAHAGQADHPAFLSDRRRRHRRALASCARRPTPPRRRTRTASPPSSSRSTTSSSRPGRRRCSSVPAANAVWAEDRILRFRQSDIGIAVAIDGGLITPVIRQAETKSLSAISDRDARNWPSARAREEAQARRIPGRLVGDLQSRHVRRARILRHHQSAARHHPGGRRGAAAGGGDGTTAASASPA